MLAKNWVDGGMDWAIAILLSDFQAAFWLYVLTRLGSLKIDAWLGLRFRLPWGAGLGSLKSKMERWLVVKWVVFNQTLSAGKMLASL